MNDPEERLVDLASQVSDGHAVDWVGEEAHSTTGGLDGLRTLSKVAEAFGALHEEPGEEAKPLFRWGHLKVLEKLGEGHFGEVFRAWDPQVGREVALKLSRGEEALVRTWLAEAQRLAKIRHPNVLTVFGAALHDQRVGIWTDLLRGPTLEERLERDGRLGAAELVAVGTELCRALAAVHGADLIHGDVKPSNVVRDEQGRLVLVDFGAARATSEGRGLAAQGTPAYLAPEVAAGEVSSPATDLFALGALLFRMATGRHVSQAGAANLRTLRPDIPTGLIAVIEGLLAEEPTARPASAGDAERLLMSSRGMASTGPRAPRPSNNVGWARAMLAVFSVTVLCILAFGGWVLFGSPGAVVAPPSATLTEGRFEASLWGERGASEVRLADGATLRPGDRLALRLEVEEPTHVYVFNEDNAGNLFVLFPLAGVEPSNPLVKGNHRLPGSLGGEPQSWEVTSAGGEERFLIVGSRNELPELERLRTEHESARTGRAVDPGDHLAEVARGVGGLRASESTGSNSLLGRLHAGLTSRRQEKVWTELLVLDNPR